MNFQFIRKIGQGGFGIVDEVQDAEGNHYARKTFHVNQGSDFQLSSNVRKRFIQEARLQSGLQHKNIVPVIYKNLDTEPPFFVMPLALSTLRFDMNKSSLLTGHFLNALMDIIAGLEELHSLSIFHRDLKPDNVLRFAGTNGDTRDFYAIGDFGLISLHQTNLTVLTQTGMKMGSDFYTAPEIVQSLKNASAQSDIYSLGCILHDIVGTEERIPCNEINEAHGEFAAILLSCTRKDPNRRFKSVKALRDALLSTMPTFTKTDLSEAPIPSDQGKYILDVLIQSKDLTEEQWQEIVNFIEDEYTTGKTTANLLLQSISIGHLEILSQHPLLYARLGRIYSEWIRANKGRFSFGSCDVLANRLEHFIEVCQDLTTQAECLMAMLYLGTSHNRWYVEQKFVSLVNKSLKPQLAKRLAVEMRADDTEVCEAIQHLRNSIHFDIESLHQDLFQTLKEVCG